jgi:trimeric autotransporter adhesin
MAISQPPFQSTLVDANDRVQTPWAQWFSQLQPILQSIVASGPTSGRPTQNLYIGYPYFDTTIDQMVYWNGVIWVTYAPSTTGTSILKGNGSGGFNNAVAGVDFAPATSGTAILYGNGSGGFSLVSIGSGVTFAGGVLSATGSGGTVTAVTGTAPIASSGGNTPAISISQAGASTNGYLSSTDWNTFNNKGSGTVTAVTGSGNIASSGGTTPNITFTGTLPIANGGTNGTATPTAGAVAVGNGTQYAFTAAGSAGQVLTSNGSTVPTWATVATGIGTTGYWGSFWDTTNQTAASTTVAYTINIGTSDPNNNGVSIVSSNRITVAYAGVYNLQYSIQFQNIGTGNKNYNVDVWFRLNGVDIPDSNSIYWIASKNSTVNGEMIAAVNYVMSLNAGDYIQILWAVSDVDISIATLPAASSPTVPRTPGVIVTVTPVTEVGIGYYNLTSVSSVAIATGSKTFTTNLSNISTAFTVGTRVRVAYVTTPANYMEGVITSFSGTTLVVNVDSIGGSGTYANWTISVAGIQGSNGVTSITGTTNQVIASASTGAVTLSLPQDIATTSSPTFVGTNFSGTATSLSIGGNAATASKWATARNLAGNSVDGSANVAFANKFIVQGTTDTGLTGAQFLGALGTGLVKNTTSTGVLSIAASGTDYAPATSGAAILYGNGSGGFSSVTIGTGVSFAAGTLSATGSGGSVTSVSFTGGLITVATATTTPAFTVAGTPGGIPYFSSASTWATSAALTANALMIGGGAGLAPATTATGTGVLTALGTNVGSAGAFVTFNGALGTPSSGTVTNLTGTASININGTVGATTATTGKFTTLEYTSTLTGGTGIIAIGTNQIYKDASGNVGIGTTAPDKNLSVFGSSAVAAGVGGEITIGGFYDGTSKISYGSIAGVNQNGSGNTSGQLIFNTRINFGALIERMRIDSVGNVGIGTTAPNASAILDAQSTTKGVRFPNMTTTQKNAISGPAAGLVVFDTTLAKLCVFSGAAWQTITSI